MTPRQNFAKLTLFFCLCSILIEGCQSSRIIPVPKVRSFDRVDLVVLHSGDTIRFTTESARYNDSTGMLIGHGTSSESLQVPIDSVVTVVLSPIPNTSQFTDSELAVIRKLHIAGIVGVGFHSVFWGVPMLPILSELGIGIRAYPWTVFPRFTYGAYWSPDIADTNLYKQAGLARMLSADVRYELNHPFYLSTGAGIGILGTRPEWVGGAMLPAHYDDVPFISIGAGTQGYAFYFELRHLFFTHPINTILGRYSPDMTILVFGVFFE